MTIETCVIVSCIPRQMSRTQLHMRRVTELPRFKAIDEIHLSTVDWPTSCVHLFNQIMSRNTNPAADVRDHGSLRRLECQSTVLVYAMVFFSMRTKMSSLIFRSSASISRIYSRCAKPALTIWRASDSDSFRGVANCEDAVV